MRSQDFGGRTPERVLVELSSYLRKEAHSRMDAAKELEIKADIIEKELASLAKRRSSGGKLTEEEVLRAMSVTCFGHIAYCCGIEKRCPFRDAALIALGISYDEFREMKERKIAEGLRELGVM